ncbi:MAG: hypothetical protein PHP50_14945 [Lachnospiraceae bacterium]|nr:hypothetical protein [Lachnospiraceae bacterium]
MNYEITSNTYCVISDTREETKANQVSQTSILVKQKRNILYEMLSTHGANYLMDFYGEHVLKRIAEEFIENYSLEIQNDLMNKGLFILKLGQREEERDVDEAS